MPELPEVQTIVNDLNKAGLTGSVVTKARVFWPATIATSSHGAFCRQMRDQTIERISRRGKFIRFHLDSDRQLVVHLRMTGRFQLAKPGTAKDRSKHVQVELVLNEGCCLIYHDTRKFGRFYLVDDSDSILGSLGPEPLSPRFTARKLTRLMTGRRRQIKPLLLDQSFIAGLGNIYVDEALWAARIHPLRKSETLTPEEIRALHRAIRKVLRQGILNSGTTLGRGQSNFYSLGDTKGRNENDLKVFRRTGQPCERCRETIHRIVVGQRSTHLCEHCQA